MGIKPAIRQVTTYVINHLWFSHTFVMQVKNGVLGPGALLAFLVSTPNWKKACSLAVLCPCRYLIRDFVRYDQSCSVYSSSLVSVFATVAVIFLAVNKLSAYLRNHFKLHSTCITWDCYMWKPMDA